MPIVDRPEVTCYRIWLQVDKTLNIRRWSSEVICALKKSSYLSRAITATIIGRYQFLYIYLKTRAKIAYFAELDELSKLS